MRQLSWYFSMALLLAASAANATVITTGGGPAARVQGALQAYAEDPLAIDSNESYDQSINDPAGNGAITNASMDTASQSLAVFDGERTVIGSSASASYSYDFLVTGGSLSHGSIIMSAYSAMSVDETYFVDPDPNAGPNVLGVAYGKASTGTFMDLDIAGTDYTFSFEGLAQDDNQQIDNVLSYNFFIADTTSGFTFLGLYSDDSLNDFTSTAFADAFTLLAGHQYRLGVNAATDYLCTSTDPTLCPTLDENGDPVDSAPQAPDSYVQSGSVSVEFSLLPVPEPGTALLFGVGIALLAGRRRN
jgi:hypothetical protein